MENAEKQDSLLAFSILNSPFLILLARRGETSHVRFIVSARLQEFVERGR